MRSVARLIPVSWFAASRPLDVIALRLLAEDSLKCGLPPDPLGPPGPPLARTIGLDTMHKDENKTTGKFVRMIIISVIDGAKE